MSSKVLNVCNHSSALWFCICDSRGRLLKCFQTHHSSSYEDSYGGAAGEALREDRSKDFPGDLGGENGELLIGMDGSGSSNRNGLDERTEIILAATFLVLIILAFISFVIYRCEKNYMRRRLQESFHMSPSTMSSGAAAGNNVNGSNNHHGNIPSISVSVQTDEALVSTTTNSSHLHHLVGNGHVINMAALLTSGAESGTPGGSAYHHHHHHHTLPHSHFRSGNAAVAGAASTTTDLDENWTNSRGIPSAQSYRDVREVIALPPITSHSRDNTLSRDHHIADIGIRSSCTADNLIISPSGNGGGGGVSNSTTAPGPLDDDLIADYAESDVMLGGSSGTNSASNGNNNNNNGSHRF